MTTLNISSNYLYDAGADALTSALKAPNCALTSVDASDNKLTDKGEKALQQFQPDGGSSRAGGLR